ncbi:MAG TPA: response regulator [Sandaracinaceae bacterium LLY-WYZ-13_1]|nr:response regulator [Sandaracinaceae bacterium LLY-WYZ-13_1]
MKVLIVDDSKAMRMIVKRALRSAGVEAEVSEAENGRQALDALLGSSLPDVVLCDWNMPEMNGLELLRRIGEENIRVKLGFVTSESTEEMRSQARQAGAEFLISKPFTPDALRQQLDALG